MKIPSVGDEFYRADERTDRQRDITKLIVAFRSFVTAYTKLVKFN